MASAVASEVIGEGRIRLSARLDGPPELVWPALTDVERLPSWLGLPLIFDLEIGGRIEVEVDSGDRFAGEFVVIDPPSRLVFTWGWRTGPIPIAPGSTTVELSLVPDGDGTVVQILHDGLGDWAERNIVGWSRKLTRLVRSESST